MSLSSILGDVSNIFAAPARGKPDPLSAIINIFAKTQGQNQANRAITAGNVPTAAESRSNDLYSALVDPNNPLRQRLAQQNNAQNLASFQQQLTEMQLANRRNAAMGRGGAFFNPERADETLSYLTSRGLPQLNALSQNQAIDQITRAAGGFQSNINPAVERNRVGIQQGVSNATYGANIPQQILDIFRGTNTSGGNYGIAPNTWQPQNYQQPAPQYNQMRY